MAEIRLPKPWLYRRPSTVAVAEGTVTFRLREWFGEAAFSTPVTNVAVFAWDGSEPEQRGVVVLEPVVVPFCWTNRTRVDANLLLLFREPVAPPPLCRSAAFARFLPHEGPDGERPADGLRLYVADPGSAARALADGGVERLTDVAGWLEEHRTVPSWAHVAEPGPEWLVSRRVTRRGGGRRRRRGGGLGG